jgi:Mlc titration factor MtfA (ptsG expression regulator)
LATLFLARKNFSGAQGMEVNDEMAVAIAAQAVLPVLKLGLSMYDGFVSIVVHPDIVVARRQTVDEFGVVHEYDEEIAGESMDGGPVMLSWRDVDDAGRTSTEGYNVTIHEFAHVLDAADAWGDHWATPGNSALHKRWSDEMLSLYDSFRADLEVDGDWNAPLDPYAATSLGEFFAVGSEAFFVDPLTLRQRMPVLYGLLGDLYRQDPAAHAPHP